MGSPHPVRRAAADIYTLAIGAPLQPLIDAVAHGWLPTIDEGLDLLDRARSMKLIPRPNQGREITSLLNRACRGLHHQSVLSAIGVVEQVDRLRWAVQELYFVAYEAGGRGYPSQRDLSDKCARLLRCPLVFEPLDRLSIELVASGIPWIDARRAASVVTTDPFGVEVTDAQS